MSTRNWIVVSLLFGLMACDPDDGQGNNLDAGVQSDGSVGGDSKSAKSDGGGPEVDQGSVAPGPRRFGFLSSYGVPSVAKAWTQQKKDLMQFSSGLVKELGTGWTREFHFIYPGPTSLSPLQKKTLNQAEKDGLTVVVTIAVDEQYFPSKKTETMAWVDKAVSTNAARLRHWQVHNEVGKKGRYTESKDYLALLAATSPVIRKACPKCTVIMGSTVPSVSYASDLVANGDKHVDAYDAHLFNEDQFSFLESFITKVNASAPKKAIFITEMATNSGKPNGGSQVKEQSEKTQAEKLLKWYARAFGLGADHVFWSQLVEWYKFQNKEDGFFDLTGVVYNGLGQVTPGEVAGKKKEAYRSLLALINKVDRFSAVKKLAQGQYRFTVNGKSVYLLWCDAGGCKLPAEIKGQVTLTDYQGKASTVGAAKISLGQTPVFVQP